MNEAINKGYLLEHFRIVHLRDSLAQTVEAHYHEFDKVVLVCAGAVDYTVEGVCYRMGPGDLLLVRHHEIHRPVIAPDSPYERFVLWIEPAFLEQCSTPDAALDRCFSDSARGRCCLLRLTGGQQQHIRALLTELEAAVKQPDFGGDILADACFRALMVHLNRLALIRHSSAGGVPDPKLDEVLQYINSHLTERLSVDALAARCYLSRYYFMRRFREATGYTVHGYIQQKRLTAAAERLSRGESVTEAAAAAGFPEYSSFLRAFRKTFRMAPGEYARRQRRLDSEYRE